MADTKISDLTQLTAPALTDQLLINDSGTSKYIELGDLGVEGTFTATLTAATPPSTPPTVTANYTILGNRCFIDMYFINVDTSGASGALSVTGVPAGITAVGTHVGSAWSDNAATFTNSPVSTIAATTINLRDADNSSVLNIIAGTAKYLRINISYRI